MCYSEVQWSWARINALGGMAEDDFRLAHSKHDVPMPQGKEKEGAEERRQKRMQVIPLSGYPDGFPKTERNGHRACVEDASGAPDLYLLSKARHNKIPVAYLDDPLGVAGGFVQQWADIYSDYQAIIDRVTGKSAKTAEDRKLTPQERDFRFKTALLAYHAFCNPANAGETAADGSQKQTDGEKLLSDDAASRLDRDEIYNHRLAGKPRRDLRERLRKLRDDYADWLNRSILSNQGRHRRYRGPARFRHTIRAELRAPLGR